MHQLASAVGDERTESSRSSIKKANLDRVRQHSDFSLRGVAFVADPSFVPSTTDPDEYARTLERLAWVSAG
jgi:hypothetical protein